MTYILEESGFDEDGDKLINFDEWRLLVFCLLGLTMEGEPIIPDAGQRELLLTYY